MPTHSPARPGFPILAALVLAAAVVPSCFSASVQSLAPIIKFQIPKFSPEGKKILLLKGDKGWRFSDDHYEIEGMHLEYYGQPADSGPKTILLSGFARFWPDKQFASGEKGVEIHRGDISMWGDAWTYDHVAKKVVLDGHVKVIFPAQAGDIIR